jgi:hypothetical protein
VQKKILYEGGGKLGILMYSKKGGVLVFMRFFLGMEYGAWGAESVVSGPLSVVRKPRTGASRIEVGGQRTASLGTRH